MVDVTAETEPHFTGTQLGWIATVLGVAWIALWSFLLCASDVFDKTMTVIGADKKPITESTFALTTAKFAVVGLIAFGSLLVLAGIVVTLGEMVKPKVTTVTAGGGAEAVPAAGVSALFVAAGEMAKAFGAALKDLRASAVLVLMGSVLMVFGGGVAWQTIPDTNRNPTIETPTDTTAPTGTTDTISPTDTTSPPSPTS